MLAMKLALEQAPAAKGKMLAPTCFLFYLVALHHRPQGFGQGREVCIQGLHILFQLGHLHRGRSARERTCIGYREGFVRLVWGWWRGAISLANTHVTTGSRLVVFLVREGELSALLFVSLFCCCWRGRVGDGFLSGRGNQKQRDVQRLTPSTKSRRFVRLILCSTCCGGLRSPSLGPPPCTPEHVFQSRLICADDIVSRMANF